MPKLLIMGDAHAYLPALEKRLPGWEIVINPEDFGAHTRDMEIFFGYPHGLAAYIDGAERLKWIQSLSAGVDSMPFDLLKERGILLTTASGVHANPISESIFGMMLGFSRGLFAQKMRQAAKKWEHDNTGMGGLTEIHGKTLGIVGAGAVGAETARLAKAFGMRVIGFRRSGAPAENFDCMYGPDGLEKLLSESDYVANILPATPETENIIAEKQFRAMKPNAVYINVGRGKTTDTAALINALNKGIIAGAGLDVTEPEPLPIDSPLWGMENVFVAGHNAGGTEKYMERAIEIFLKNLDGYLSTGTPEINPVDLNAGY